MIIQFIDNFYICQYCQYRDKYKNTVKKHFLDKHANLDETKIAFKYYCKDRDYGTFDKHNYNTHKNVWWNR